MLDGLGSVLVAVLLLVAVMLGVVLGRYAWPRRPHRQGGSLQPAPSFPPDAVLLASGEYRSEPANDAQLADAQARAAEAEARVDRYRAWVSELEGRLSGSQSTLKETRHQLKQTEAELVRIRQQVQQLEVRKEAEMGRLESGAIAALESAIATHREQVAKLEEKLRAAESTAEEHVRELAVERSRSAQLRSALAEREQHIVTMMSERA